ncbi:MAG: SH3 domain-containing protein [Pseudomonadota bacterium]
MRLSGHYQTRIAITKLSRGALKDRIAVAFITVGRGAELHCIRPHVLGVLARTMGPVISIDAKFLVVVLVLGAAAITGTSKFRIVVSQIEFVGTASAETVRQAPERGPTTVAPSGLRIPRFVSLKAQPVNMRRGPGMQFPTRWVMRRAGTPLEVLREYDGWREVRDADGSTGWILGSLLSGRRTALVRPWSRAASSDQVGALVDLRRSPSERADRVARLEAGTNVSVETCDRRWCKVRLDSFRGYVKQSALWGVYRREVID